MNSDDAIDHKFSPVQAENSDDSLNSRTKDGEETVDMERDDDDDVVMKEESVNESSENDEEEKENNTNYGERREEHNILKREREEEEKLQQEENYTVNTGENGRERQFELFLKQQLEP